jgi:general secretion pathway protein G
MKVVRGESGFTLIEMMLVVIIIGILASMVVPSFVRRSQEARIKATRGDIASLGTALNLFELDKGRYPTSLSEMLTAHRPYFQGTAAPKDHWGNEYLYSSSGQQYMLRSRGPDGVEGTNDDILPANM